MLDFGERPIKEDVKNALTKLNIPLQLLYTIILREYLNKFNEKDF